MLKLKLNPQTAQYVYFKLIYRFLKALLTQV